MIEELGKRSVPIVESIFYGAELSEAGFEGRSPGDFRTRKDGALIVRTLLAESG